MRYVGNVIRPPSEADSLIVQATTGCSHNRCRFCGAYPQPFTIKPLQELESELDWFLRRRGDDVRRLFLADGNALVRSAEDLLAFCAAARHRFPRLRRVGIYANARDVARKTDDELARLRTAGLTVAYLGLESGDDDVLGAMDKGCTAAEAVTAVRRLQAAGINASVMSLLGLAGDDPAASERHALRTAAALNEMQPRFASFLTVMLVPGTPLAQDAEAGRFRLPEPPNVLRELRTILAALRLEGARVYANHASNWLPLEGSLPRDQSALLGLLDEALAGRVPLVPDLFRGL